MPKQGYYYYDNIRAMRTLAFFCLFGLGLFLAKRDGAPSQPAAAIPETSSFMQMYIEYRLPVLIVALSLIAILLAYRAWRRRFSEPHPRDFRSRAEFIAALQAYCERNRYKHGWVYYRSKELWPEN